MPRPACPSRTTRSRRSLAVHRLDAAAARAVWGGGEPPAGVANVPMFDNFYARDVTRVPVGGKVRFPNEGRVPYNAVAVDGSWRTPESIARDEAATITVDRP